MEGQVTRILDVAPEGRSPLEVLRNYEQELTKSGYNILFQCSGKDCGTDYAWLGPDTISIRASASCATTLRRGRRTRWVEVTEFALTGAKDAAVC